MTPEQKELWRRTDEVLQYLWDPCQSAWEPMARDEYSSYVPQVFAALVGGATAAEIAAALDSVQRERLGNIGSANANLAIGDLLVKWREHLREQHT